MYFLYGTVLIIVLLFLIIKIVKYRINSLKEKRVARFKIEYSKLYQGLIKKLDSFLEKNTIKHNRMVFDFKKRLVKKYPYIYDQYVLYYILIDTEPNYDICKHFDFPDDDSVLKFINHLKD